VYALAHAVSSSQDVRARRPPLARGPAGRGVGALRARGARAGPAIDTFGVLGSFLRWACALHKGLAMERAVIGVLLFDPTPQGRNL